MYQLAHIANTILYRAKGEDMPISPMKLQKLVYFLYGEHLYRERKALFSERFEVWKYGPVLDDVYQAFKQFGAGRIKKYMPDANGLYQVVDLNSDRQFRACFDKVWDSYSDQSGIELSKLTHQERSAWYIAASKRRTFLNDADILAEMRHRNDRQTREDSPC